jgi:arylsulfatase A-like enzyme/uncharacterized cupredoxin-like copper-binding protein
VAPSTRAEARLERAPLATELVSRTTDAYFAVVALALGELVLWGLLHRRELVGVFELSRALRGLAPLALVAAFPIALAAGPLIVALLRSQRASARVTLTLTLTLAGAWLGHNLSGGRRASELRTPITLCLGALSGGLAYALGPRVARLALWASGAAPPGARPTPRWAAAAWTLGWLGVVVAVATVNVRVLPRLYPTFHAALTALACVLATLALAPLAARSLVGLSARACAALSLAVVGVLAAPSGARALAPQDNARLVLASAPDAGHLVHLAARLAPPPPLDADDDVSLVAEAGRELDLRGRDVLLVTIDALRADHVGAYGYARPVTPRLDALAREGAVFEHAYTTTPHTSYALTSLLTGKYMRPLVLQGLGEGSETMAALLRRYDVKTAAFYPPAIFYVDGERMRDLAERGLDFEYRRVEFVPAARRVDEVDAYLATLAPTQRAFLWVHLFEPHEPYEAHAEHPFGDRDLDRYDAEIAAADRALGAIVDRVRARSPGAVVIVAADHGEEFGEHGGRYHGTTVYEEQVRVPLVMVAPGAIPPSRIASPTSLVDVLPTVLSGLSIPRPARLRGFDRGAELAGKPAARPSQAFAETDEQTLLAEGALRLVCARKLGACALYDLASDPGQRVDVGPSRRDELSRLRTALRRLESSHGKYEQKGLRAENKGWPEALRRGLSGDGEAAPEIAPLLDDADVAVRRKAAEVLFELRRRESAPALRLALLRDEDDEVKAWCALGLTRLGEGAPRARDLLASGPPAMRRLAALAFAEAGDDRGLDVLVAWVREAFPRERADVEAPLPERASGMSHERAREVIAALGGLRAKRAVPVLVHALADVRLRPHVAKTLGLIGDDFARPSLAERLWAEPYVTARVALAEALVTLGGKAELRGPLVRWLGAPDPLPGGVGLALRAGLVPISGGPRDRDLERLRKLATSGAPLPVVIPKVDEPDDLPAPPKLAGLRVLCRASSRDGAPGELRVGLRDGPAPYKSDGLVPGKRPSIVAGTEVKLEVSGQAPSEPFASLPESVRVRPGDAANFVVYATQNVKVEACLVVPLRGELPRRSR